MAITFLQQKQRQKYLMLVFLIVIILILIVIWKGFIAKPEQTIITSPIVQKPPKVEINYEILKQPLLKELQPFEEFEPLEEGIGRENPFLPY